MRSVEIFDTTLRDGEQSPGAAMSPDARLEIAALLESAGVDCIEAGFPAASPAVAASVKEIANVIRDTRVAALARCVKSDIDAAAQALRGAAVPTIHVFIATSPIHLRYKLGITPKRALEMAVEGVQQARQHCDFVEFSAEDATRSDPDFLAHIFSAAICAGATTINVPDTVGYALPSEMQELIARLRQNVDGIEGVNLSVHTHDDLGMATANALAAVSAGANQIECTVNGIGERAGNCALEEVVAAVRTRSDILSASVRFDLRKVRELSALVARATRMPVQKNKAIVGANAFAHESGIHQDGVLKERKTYEILDPQLFGTVTELPLGRNSGRRGLFHRTAKLGLTLDAAQRTRFFEAFTRFAAERSFVSDEDLVRIAHDATVI